MQSVAVTAIVMLVGLVSGVIAARALGVDGRGQLAAVILWPAVLASLAELGLPTAFTYLSASRRSSSHDLARGVIPLVALQSLLLYVVGVPVIVVVLSGYPMSVQVSAIGFLVAYAPSYLLVRYLSALNQGEGRIGVFNLARLLIPSIYAAVLIALLLFGLVSVRVFAGADGASWVATDRGSLRRFQSGHPLGCRQAAHRPHNGESSVVSWISDVFRYLGAGGHSPAGCSGSTTAVLGAREAGFYFVATSAGALVRTWGTTLGSLSLPRVAAATSREEALVAMSLFVRITMILSGLSAVALLLFAGPLLRLVYGEAFVPAETLVRILAVGMLAASLRYVLGDGLRGNGKPAQATQAEIVGWLVGGAALLVLLPLWGVNGVAVAVSASYITTLLVMLRFSARLGAHPARLLVPTVSDFSNGRAVLRSTLRGRKK